MRLAKRTHTRQVQLKEFSFEKQVQINVNYIILTLTRQMVYNLLDEQCVRQELLHNKYLNSKMLSQVDAKPIDSLFWRGLMKSSHPFSRHVPLRLVAAN